MISKNAKSSVLIAFIILVAAALLLIFTNFNLIQQQPPELDDSLLLADTGNEPIPPIPDSIPLNKHKVILGEKLFHDKKLSADNTVSCASCHDLLKGGGDNLPTSFGIDNQKGTFNSQTVYNSAFNHYFFWDGRAATLEAQAVGPLFAANEMGNTSWDKILNYLNASKEYQKLFEQAYQKAADQQSVPDAIAEYQRSLITPNSRFDLYLKGNHNALNAEEVEGYELFKSRGCISCHNGINAGGNQFQKAGVFQPISEADPNAPETLRVAPLRNIALTAPYFHDGSTKTLNQAIKSMAESQLGIELSEEETNKIEAFLNTLTGEFEQQPLQNPELQQSTDSWTSSNE